MEYESILSDLEDYMKEYKATLKKRTSSESHDKKRKTGAKKVTQRNHLKIHLLQKKNLLEMMLLVVARK